MLSKIDHQAQTNGYIVDSSSATWGQRTYLASSNVQDFWRIFMTPFITQFHCFSGAVHFFKIKSILTYIMT